VTSIVVLAHNKSRYTRLCIESVLASDAEDAELIVVDNGSTDDTPEVLAVMEDAARDKSFPFRLLRQDKNLGCSTARNLGVEAARGEEVVFLDNDTLVRDPRWLDKLRSVLRDHPRAGIVGPRLCYPIEPYRIQCAGVGVSRTGRVLFRGRGEAQDDPRFARVEEVQALISACWIFSKRLYVELGGMDEAFNPVQYEDLDLCYRARSRGWRTIYTPDPVVYHWESITSDGTPHIPNRYIVIKHGMLFKARWRHMFEKEDGPSDEETQWRAMDVPSLEGRRER